MVGGLVGLPAAVGFGASVQIPTVLSASIDVSSLFNVAFTVPRDGNITALSVYFSSTVGLSLLSAMTMTAQIYSSETPNNIFIPVTGALVNLSMSVLNIGSVFSGSATGLSIPVTADTRLLLVVSVSGGLTLASTVLGNFSAGLAIS